MILELNSLKQFRKYVIRNYKKLRCYETMWWKIVLNIWQSWHDSSGILETMKTNIMICWLNFFLEMHHTV